MFPSVMSFKSIGIIAFGQLMIKLHLEHHPEHELNEVCHQFLNDTKSINIDALKQLPKISIKAYKVLVNEYQKVINTFEEEITYSPIILAFDLMDEWFNSEKALISLPSYLKGYEFTAILDLAIEHHGGWNGYIKTSRTLSKALCTKLIQSSCV